MGFLDLLVVAAMPTMEVLIVAALGAFLATEYCGILTPDARKSLNKIVFYVFTPSLVFGTLAKTITIDEIISWWFMPVNIALTFVFGTVLGRIAVKILRPPRHLEGLIVASCSAGNLGNLLIIIVPAVCAEEGSQFGIASVCQARGIAYASFSLAVANIYIWTHTLSLIRDTADEEGSSKVPNKTPDADHRTRLLSTEDEQVPNDGSSPEYEVAIVCSLEEKKDGSKVTWWGKLMAIAHQVAGQILAPPSSSAMAGFIVGSIPWLKNLIIGSSAPLRVFEDAFQLLGAGTIPSITLILGGNLTKGKHHSGLRPSLLIAISAVRYVLLPVIGIAVVKGAAQLDLLPKDPLFQYTLMIQFTLPPAMNIGTMIELFDVGKEECSVIFLWTYAIAAVALTMWSTVYMWILAGAA